MEGVRAPFKAMLPYDPRELQRSRSQGSSLFSISVYQRNTGLDFLRSSQYTTFAVFFNRRIF